MAEKKIFVALGSQKFSFNRLLKKVDEMVASGEIAGEVFAQTGFSDYVPRHYPYTQFLNRTDFNDRISACDILIAHGGTGIIVNAVRLEKKVIVVPRLAKFGEHVDNHQLQIMNQFAQMNLIYPCAEIEALPKAFREVQERQFDRYVSNRQGIIDSLQAYIDQLP